MQNQVFFPQSTVDLWCTDGMIDLVAGELILLNDDRRYKVEESVHIVVEVTGAADPHGLVGKVKSKRVLAELNAEILENSMIVGDHAYDIVPGWSGIPNMPFADFSRNRAANGNIPEFTSDEAMLKAMLGLS